MNHIKNEDKRSIPLALTESDHLLKNGDLLGIWNNSMDIEPDRVSFHGLYFKGMRYLSSHHFFVDETSPLPLHSGVSDGDGTQPSPYYRHLRLLGPKISIFTNDSHNTSFQMDGPLLIERKRFCFPSGIAEEIIVFNHAPFLINVPISFKIDSDFRDIMDVRGIRDPWPDHSVQYEFSLSEGFLAIYCKGLDLKMRKTSIWFDKIQCFWVDGRLKGTLTIPAHQNHTFQLKIQCEEKNSTRPYKKSDIKFRPIRSVSTYLKQDLRSQQIYRNMWPTITGRRLPLGRWSENAINDLRILMTPTKFGHFPYAGVPWFSTPFGRDALISGFSTLWAFPPLTKTVLCFLAATQARKNDPFRDAETGKILHEFRYGEAGSDPSVPFGKYYGSVDATPLFIALTWEYLKRTGDHQTVHHLKKSINRAMEWIEKNGVNSSTGFLVYKSDHGKGLVQKGWKDSGDSVFHSNGELAQGPIALAEVQGYLFMAYRAFAKLSNFYGNHSTANLFEKKSTELKDRFNRYFWSDRINMFSLAIDGQGNPCEVRTSNAGHVLFTEIAYEKYARKTAEQLLKPDLFSGWGIRTLGSKEVRYNPVSYHNGSIWPHDNALILSGLSKYGLKDQLSVLAEAYFQTLLVLPSERPPELFCGFTRRTTNDAPLSYPTSCRIQAWSVSSFFMVIQSIASLDFNRASKYDINYYSSSIPSLDSLTIENVIPCTSNE